MALMNNDIVQVRFSGFAFAQHIMLIRTYRVIGDFPLVDSMNTDLQRILTSVSAGGNNDIETPYLACLPATYSMSQIFAQRIKPVRAAFSTLNLVGGAPGTNAGAASSANHTGAITLRTALAGRKQRGTVHIGPSPDAAALAGLIVPAYQVLLNSLLAKLITSFGPVGSGAIVAPVLLHTDGTSDAIISGIVQPQSRVQRRRTVGVGE